MIHIFLIRFTKRFSKVFTPFFIAIFLVSCGGDPTITTGGGEGVSKYSLRNLNINLKNLSAGGSTGITVELFDKQGDLVTESQSVIFSSLCIAKGLSEIDTPITSSTGVFSTTYTSKACEGEDEITASYGKQKLKSTIDIQAANLGSVEFISAEPQTITLQGMSAPGQQHTSRIKFQIKNDVGGPIADVNVKFVLSTNVGGVELSVLESRTDNEGFVSTILQAGSVHTNVRVRAIVERDGDIISSESSQLVISTGIADQNSLSMSLSVHNPSAWNHDGEVVIVSVLASDRYNNPVPDGTTVAFFTELGQIQPSCQITNGGCSVTWTSSDPRDLGTLDNRYPRNIATNFSDGISTVTAMVIGEESFIDSNSNGVFDDGDQFDLLSDRGEAYEEYSKNYDIDNDGLIDNTFDEGLDPYIDFNGNGIRDARDGKYTGLGCKHSTLCASDNGLKNIFVSAEIVMAENAQRYRLWQGGVGSTLVTNNTVKNGVVYTVEIFGARNHQVPPFGTVVSVSSDEADVVFGGGSIASTSMHRADLTNPAGGYTVQMLFKDKDIEKQDNGTIELKIDTPKGQSISYFFFYLDNG